MGERNNSVPLRESLKDAPEFTQPFVARTLHGTQLWPLTELPVNGGENNQKVIFEALSAPDEELPQQRVRISYESRHGLKAKRTLVERKTSKHIYTFEGGEIRFSFDDSIQIFYSTTLKGPFIYPGILEDPANFTPAVHVTSGNDPIIPPLAVARYDPTSKIPIDVRFPNADYKKALVGDVDKRKKQEFNHGSYSETYFQWEHLVGAKVGVSTFDNEEHSDWLQYYRWITQVNNSSSTQIGDTPYKGKLTRTIPRFGRDGRLRLSRMNPQSGESWMFSIPDWIDNKTFHSDVQNKRLEDFFSEYPVIFCVKKHGQERQWHSTWGTIDR